MKRIACLRLPHWPLQRLVAAQPELEQRPIIIHQRDSRRGERVVDCSALAQRAGVRIGMPLAEAKTLLSRELRALAVFVPEDPEADLAALGKLAECCEAFSPLVGWRTTSPPGVAGIRQFDEQPPAHLLLDLTGVGALFGGEAALAEQLVAECRRRRYTVRLAIGPSIGASWILASAGETYCVLADTEPLDERLGPYGVGALRLPAETLERLGQLGVATIQQVRRLSRGGLAQRLGELLLLRLDQAFDDGLQASANESIVAHRPPPSFQAAAALEHPTDRCELLETVFEQLLERLTQELRLRQRGVVRLIGRLERTSGAAAIWEIGLFRPTACPRQLLDLLRLRLEQNASPGLVGRVVLQAALTAPLEQRQAELFDHETRDAQRQIASLLERLSSRLGAEAVRRAELRRDALPERAYAYTPLVGQTPSSLDGGAFGRSSRRAARSSSGESSSGAAPRASSAGFFEAFRESSTPPTLAAVSYRPLRLVAPPAPLDTVAIVPEGPPASFFWQDTRHLVAHSWGPERIETGWWRHGTVRRDYYRVETTAGRRFWLFRDLDDGQWFLHGIFE